MNRFQVELHIVPVPPSPKAQGVLPSGFALELANASGQVRLPVYRRTDTDQVRISDYLLHQRDLPFALPARPYYSVATAAGLFVPMEDLLLALYQQNQVSSPFLAFLAELRASLRLSVAPLRAGARPRDVLQPAVAEEGFYLLDTVSHGRTHTVRLGWICPQDRGHLDRALWFDAGALQLRTRPNRALDTGKWMTPSAMSVTVLLQRYLREIWSGTPLSLFTEAGRQLIIDSFPWTPLTLMNKKGARQARVEFVRSHPELKDKPGELAWALLKAKLYSETCNPREITKLVQSLIAEAFGMQEIGA